MMEKAIRHCNQEYREYLYVVSFLEQHYHNKLYSSHQIKHNSKQNNLVLLTRNKVLHIRFVFYSYKIKIYKLLLFHYTHHNNIFDYKMDKYNVFHHIIFIIIRVVIWKIIYKSGTSFPSNQNLPSFKVSFPIPQDIFICN